MSRKSLILSSAGLKHIAPNINNTEDEFLFVFGEKEIRMSKISADFISPYISSLHRSDPTLNTYKYPGDESMKEIFVDHNLQLFNSICRGNEVHINEEEGNKLRQLSILLGNEEFFNRINELFSENNKKTKFDELFKLLSIEYLRKNGIVSTIINAASIDDIASCFYEIDKNLLINLPCEIILAILKNDNLKLEDEDSLFEFIEEFSKVHEKEGNFNEIEFLEEVEIGFLSKDKLRIFLSKINLDGITNCILDKIKLIILEGEQGDIRRKSSRYLLQEIEYNGEESGAFKGIISLLTKKCGGNVSDKNEVIVTSSSIYDNNFPKNAADFEGQTNFCTKNEENSWLKYDFKNRKIRPTHYSIRSHYDAGKSGCHPQNWVIEGSNTDQDDDWKKLDSRNGITYLSDASKIHTFDIQEKIDSNEFFRYLRIRQTGKGANGYYHLMLSAIEYFGSIS